MRLIDADALKKKAQECAIEAWKMNLTARIETILNQFIDWIDEAPTVDQWIPCSERLPKEEGKTYWVCTDAECQCECRWTNNRFGMGEGEWGWSIFDTPQYTKPIAWMPLPEPYREDGEV